MTRCATVHGQEAFADRAGPLTGSEMERTVADRRVALLRGVNLGGRRLFTSDLARICTELGYDEPRTFLASGNVLFSADGPEIEIEAALEEAPMRFGLSTDVLVRTGAELKQTISADHSVDAVLDHPSHVLVTFHREPFPPEALVRLRAEHDGPEQLYAIGGCSSISADASRCASPRCRRACVKHAFPRSPLRATGSTSPSLPRCSSRSRSDLGVLSAIWHSRRRPHVTSGSPASS